MHSKKQARSIFPGMHRLLLLLANTHPMVIVTTPAGQNYHARGRQPT